MLTRRRHACSSRGCGSSCGSCLEGPTGSLAPDSRVTVRVEHFVELPLLGRLFRGERGGIRVDATHVELVDRFKETG